MNIIFLTITPIENLSSPSVHIGVLKQFRDAGNNVYIVSPYERKIGKDTELMDVDGVHILHVKTGNITKCGMIEKGLTTLLIDSLYYRAINQYLKDISFGLVLYSTPPITLCGVIERIKKKNNCDSYLMLKDIFPQNAVDIGMMSKNGPKGLLYKHFRNQEKKLYRVSDHIGCMSQANVDYVIKHNPEVDPAIVEICPNSIDVVDKSVDEHTRNQIREKYGIPLDKKVFIYGGNLGKPQGIPFLIECMRKCEGIEDSYFLIVGDGTEYGTIEKYVETEKPQNVKLMKRLPKEDYDTMVGACDVGLIFLDHRFTIPNFPSRLLGYMQAKIPVMAVTDPNTDIGAVITEGGFGWWCESNDENTVKKAVEQIITEDLKQKGMNGFEYLLQHYSAQNSYITIISHFCGLI